MTERRRPLNALWNTYAFNLKGLSREIWFLALVTFLNRAWTMVIACMIAVRLAYRLETLLKRTKADRDINSSMKAG